MSRGDSRTGFCSGTVFNVWCDWNEGWKDPFLQNPPSLDEVMASKPLNWGFGASEEASSMSLSPEGLCLRFKRMHEITRSRRSATVAMDIAAICEGDNPCDFPDS